jgi:hypothetical protein
MSHMNEQAAVSDEVRALKRELVSAEKRRPQDVPAILAALDRRGVAAVNPLAETRAKPAPSKPKK